MIDPVSESTQESMPLGISSLFLEFRADSTKHLDSTTIGILFLSRHEIICYAGIHHIFFREDGVYENTPRHEYE